MFSKAVGSSTRNTLLPLFLFILISGIFLSVSYSLYSFKKSFDQRNRISRAEDIRRRLELRFESTLAATLVLKERLLQYEVVDLELFIRESRMLRSHFLFFQAINFVNPQGTIEWVTPIEGNEQALGRNLIRHEIIGGLLGDSRAKNEILLSPPLALMQGGSGIVFYIPMQRDREFLGWLNIVFRLDPFVEYLFSNDELGRYQTMIFDETSDVILYSNFRTDNRTTYDHHFRFYDRPWVVRLSEEPTTFFYFFIFLSGAIVVFLTGVVSFSLKRYLDYWDSLETKLERALNETNLLRALGHDLNTPLTVTNLLIDRLEGMESSSQVDKVCRQLRENVERQERMLRGVRDLQVIRDRRSLDNLEAVNIKEGLLQVSKLFDEVLGAKSLSLSLDLQIDDQTAILAKSSCFEDHIMSNLLTNAAKFSPQGGELKLRAYQESDRVIIELDDPGPGLPKQVLESLAKYRTSKSNSGTLQESGTGFGLLLVKNFVELFDGELEFIRLDDGLRAKMSFKVLSSYRSHS